jgi:predicted phage terminase large subunit-like protein
MQCVTVGAKVTGNRADALFVDDPLDAKDAFSKVARDAVLLWWDQAFANRLNDADRGVRVVIMQRLHEEDLSGHVLKQGGWNHLMLPMEFDSSRADPRDPRTIEGEPLNLRRFPLHIIESEKKRLGPWGAAGQLQQSPVPVGGEMFSPRWWRYWSHDIRLAPGPRPAGAWELPARQLPTSFDLVWTSWDCTFKDLQTSDWVVGTVWGKVGADFYLLGLWRRRAGLVETIEGMKAMAKAYPKAWTHLIEDKANGTAAIEMLRSQIPGILAVEPKGGKESRAAAIQPIVAAGNVFLPEDAPWMSDYVLEFARFPKGAHDDQVDSSSQAISNILNSAVLRLRMMNTPLNS